MPVRLFDAGSERRTGVPALRRKKSKRKNWALLIIAAGAAVSFLAISLLAQQSISIEIREPEGYGATNLRIVVVVTSTYEIQSVKAAVETHEVNLTFSSCSYVNTHGTCVPGWVGNLSLSGLQKGQKILTVTATDVRGNQNQAQKTFLYDDPPVLTVTSPLTGAVARPFVRVTATCTDDDPNGCRYIKVYTDSTSPVASGRSSIDLYVRPSTPSLYVRIVAVDSSGQTVERQISVFIETNPGLIEVDQISDDGTINIIDMQDNRLLYLQGTSLRILDRSSRQVVVIPSPPISGLTHGFLTPKGAIFAVPGTPDTIYDWRDGSLQNLGLGDDFSLKAKGSYAIWNDGTNVLLRDLVAGANTTFRKLHNYR